MQPDLAITDADVRSAAERLQGQAINTPFLTSRTLSELCGCEIWLKFENHQFTASFKERGALNKLLSLTAEQAGHGVLAVSAGNHAQAVAYHAQRLGMNAVIVMPRHTPTVKISRTRHFGAEIILAGETFDEALQHGLKLAEERRLTLVHPYDDPYVIAGQGTVALEMLEAQPELDALVIAIGGGGLIGGISVIAKATRPGIRIFGVQSEAFPAMHDVFHGRPGLSMSASIAEGIAVKTPGLLTRALAQRYVDDIFLVSEDEIENALIMLLEIEKTVVEGAGAAGLAGVIRNRRQFTGQRVGLVLCGGNIDSSMLSDVIAREMVRSGRLARLRVDLRDIPGALARAAQVIANAAGNIEEVHHQRAFTLLPARSVEVDIVVQARDGAHVGLIIDELNRTGFRAVLHNQ
ncbi:MAG: threonine ammonia-lyase [Rhodocyclaceae bacterium]|nr:MAG: threonine ammonia-lyase [Rhodocyclaceae bacterium]